MADLKRDIKKLQRFREDIMKWMSNPEVKEKGSLQEFRRRIEIEMERFKAFERESKTKPFSLMGLAMGDRVDAHEQKKQEKRENLEEVVERLTVHADGFRAEWESLVAKKKKSKDEGLRIDELKKLIDRHAFHLGNLEQVLRRLDNDMIDPDDLDILLDSLNIYLEQFEDPDYYHDEGVYEMFNLDSDMVDNTYYKPTLEESAEGNGNIPAASSSSGIVEAPKVREVPLTAAAKAKAKKQAAREIEAAQTGGPVRPDHPAQPPPKPARPAIPTISPPSLPTPLNPPTRPAPLLEGVTTTGPPPPPPPQRSAWSKLEEIEFSYRSKPSCEDYVRLRGYIPSNPYVHLKGAVSVYPTKVSGIGECDLLGKVPLDTLAMMFYYREGTCTQLSAAQELQRRSWRFHRKLGLWFRRSDSGSVKSVNPAFEYGSYAFFDISGDNWEVRTRNDFTFEYEHLDDPTTSAASCSFPSSNSSEDLLLAIRRPQTTGV
jgi:CCR4-NOT transcription complex subunit 3